MGISIINIDKSYQMGYYNPAWRMQFSRSDYIYVLDVDTLIVEKLVAEDIYLLINMGVNLVNAQIEVLDSVMFIITYDLMLLSDEYSVRYFLNNSLYLSDNTISIYCMSYTINCDWLYNERKTGIDIAGKYCAKTTWRCDIHFLYIFRYHDFFILRCLLASNTHVNHRKLSFVFRETGVFIGCMSTEENVECINSSPEIAKLLLINRDLEGEY